jgi:hypothetical protein
MGKSIDLCSSITSLIKGGTTADVQLSLAHLAGNVKPEYRAQTNRSFQIFKKGKEERRNERKEGRYSNVNI